MTTLPIISATDAFKLRTSESIARTIKLLSYAQRSNLLTRSDIVELTNKALLLQQVIEHRLEAVENDPSLIVKELTRLTYPQAPIHLVRSIFPSQRPITPLVIGNFSSVLAYVFGKDWIKLELEVYENDIYPLSTTYAQSKLKDWIKAVLQDLEQVEQALLQNSWIETWGFPYEVELEKLYYDLSFSHNKRDIYFYLSPYLKN